MPPSYDRTRALRLIWALEQDNSKEGYFELVRIWLLSILLRTYSVLEE